MNARASQREAIAAQLLADLRARMSDNAAHLVLLTAFKQSAYEARVQRWAHVFDCMEESYQADDDEIAARDHLQLAIDILEDLKR